MIPAGQKARADFPRFGLPQYASRFPTKIDNQKIEFSINGRETSEIDLSSSNLPRTTIQADFHCVTTWSYLGAEWSGVRFSDLFKHLKDSSEAGNLEGAVFFAQDGYKTSLILEDLLSEDVLVADTLDGEPLSIDHGAPLRLVAPAHYGYKNLKHLSRIELHSKLPVIKRGIRAFLDHPRARVSKEERGKWIPGWILRYPYRLLIQGTIKDHKKAMRHYKFHSS